jgi:hypothetical protein
MKINT